MARENCDFAGGDLGCQSGLPVRIVSLDSLDSVWSFWSVRPHSLCCSFLSRQPPSPVPFPPHTAQSTSIKRVRPAVPESATAQRRSGRAPGRGGCHGQQAGQAICRTGLVSPQDFFLWASRTLEVGRPLGRSCVLVCEKPKTLPGKKDCRKKKLD